MKAVKVDLIIFWGHATPSVIDFEKEVVDLKRINKLQPEFSVACREVPSTAFTGPIKMEIRVKANESAKPFLEDVKMERKGVS